MEIRALVVDDSGIMRKMVMRTLIESKLAIFNFTEAKDGLDALQKYDPQATDIIFADWNMPNLCGLDMVKAIRSTEAQGRHVPIVMITTEGTMGKVEEALNDGGVDCYIVKPFTVDIVVQKLEPLLARMAEEQKKPSGFFGKLAAKLN